MPNGNAANNIDDVLSYPILTEEVRHPEASRPGPNGASGSSQYGQIVEGALRDILGWRIKGSDPKGFLSALNQSFQLTQVEGHTEWQWKQHTYAIDADLGAVTGAQAALYSRAKAALNQALPLLDGLKTLLAASDEQEIEAMTAIVRSSLIELVNELGEEGGPIISRVDQYFELLLGPNPNSTLKDPEQVGGQLGLLRDAFGLVRRNVNTIAEEQDLTNFLILVDYVNSLKLTWAAQKDFFDRQGTDVFLGTQLVLLSRTLAVVAESVQETYFVMDSVFLGQAERQVTKLDLGTGSPIFVGELLSWVERFALEEGPRLLKEGGKDGVIHAFGPTVKKISKLVEAAAKESANGSSNPTHAFHTLRVQRSLEELSAQLRTTSRLAATIKREPRPSVIAVDPEELISGDVNAKVIINGADFKNGATVKLNQTGLSKDEILPSKVVFVDEAEIKATFDLTGIPGNTVWSVLVTNPDGQYDRMLRAITVTRAPDALPPPQSPLQANVLAVSPSHLWADTPRQAVTINGENFDKANAIVTLRNTESPPFSIAGTVLQNLSSSTILVARFDLTGISKSDGVLVGVRNPMTNTVLADVPLPIFEEAQQSRKAGRRSKKK